MTLLVVSFFVLVIASLATQQVNRENPHPQIHAYAVARAPIVFAPTRAQRNHLLEVHRIV